MVDAYREDVVGEVEILSAAPCSVVRPRALIISRSNAAVSGWRLKLFA